MTQKNSRLILGLGAISLLICTALNVSSAIFIAVIIGWVLVVLLLISLEAALFFLIFLRPSIDILSSYNFPDFPIINLGAIIAIITIVLSIMYMYQNRKIMYRSHIPLIWSLILIICVYIALSFTGVSFTAGLQETVRLVSFICFTSR
jgi:hypothetical protein